MISHEVIVIAGIAGRLPESANLEEFWNNLLNGTDMVTDIQDRWNPNAFPMPRRMGHLSDLKKFDAEFFGINGKQVEKMDPRMRFSLLLGTIKAQSMGIFLELTYEAIIDAGINPATIRGSRTGVYLGSCGEEVADALKKEFENPSGYGATGACLSMMANRISYTFDFNGPSMVIDTACSSSLLALNEALVAIRTGVCESALVAGINLIFNPKNTLTFTNLGMTSMEGKCRSFDAAGEGYVRSEAAVVIYICKYEVARRSYATIVHGKTNCDGYKTNGVTFPSGIVQEQLLREVYAEAGINPKDVDYVEAHGTGTRAGDPEELNAIARVFCAGRDPDKPLLIGAVKSNMGHPEPAAGLCQIAKVILSHQHGVIPGNLHYLNPNPDIPALLDGRIKVIDKNTKFNGSLVGINSFGFGGTNVHVLLKLNQTKYQDIWPTWIPIIVPFSGRTEQVEFSLEKLMRTQNHCLFALLQKICATNIPGHNFRSYGIKYGNEIIVKFAEMKHGNKRPIWFVFSGMGAQYIGMVRNMLNIRIVRESIAKSVATAKAYDFELENVLYSEDECVFDDVINSFASITSLQIALIDLLNALGIIPDGIIGHSLGEIASAYADGCLTDAQTLLVTIARGRAFNKAKFPGAMATVGLTWAEAERRCPENVYIACHNAIDNITFSGPADLITKLVKDLNDEKIFARIVHSSGFAFHCRYMNPAEPFLREYLYDIIPGQAARTSRWISTSVPENKKNSDLGNYCDVEYFINNAMSTVRFYEGMQHIPQNAVTIEIASRNFLQSILKRSLPTTVSYIALMNHKATDNVFCCIESLGQLYLEGTIPLFGALYDAIDLPAPATTPMIGLAILWDHSDDWHVPSEHMTTGGSKRQISLNEDSDSFYSGHVIDGRTIFPAAGYMWLVWLTFAKQKQKEFAHQPIVFEKLRFERNTMLPKEGSVEFIVNIWPDNGDFEVYEKESAVFHGSIRELTKNDEMFPELEDSINTDDEENYLDGEDFYKELRLRGYEYSGVFRGVHRVGTSQNRAEIKWNDNWVGFLDSLLQISIVQQPRGLYLPIRLQKAIIDPKMLMDYTTSNNYIPAVILKDVKTIKAPGIELRGVKVSIAPRRPAISDPKLSMHTFVPYLEDSERLSPQQCLESVLEIVLENTSAQNLVLTEIQENNWNEFLAQLIPILTSKFSNPNIFLLTDNPTSEFELLGVKVMNTKDKALPKDANLVVSSKGSFETGNKLVGENGFLLLRGTVEELNLFPYKLVAQKLESQLFLYVKKTEISCVTKPALQITNENFDWVETAKSFLIENSSKLFLYSNGVEPSGMFGFIRCLLKEGYKNIRCYNSLEDNYGIDFDNPSQLLERQIVLDLVFNVYKKGGWGCYCNLSILPEELAKPGAVCESFVNALNPGDLSTLTWIESPLSIEQDAKLVCVNYYSSLNFRDVMLVTGMLSKDALPTVLAHQECVLGSEFCGKINGKFVCGAGLKSLATSIAIYDNPFLFEVPPSWSPIEAATIPIAYGTAYYALRIRAKMREGETVLIHSGSGAVGQACIAIALSLKCKIITTVGTAKKREFLKVRFPALDNNSFTDSKNASVFEKHVMAVTNGRGVDIVVNSLANEKLEASVRCLAKFGRFIEIGKLDLFKNTALGMEIFLSSINFEGIVFEDVVIGRSRARDKCTKLIETAIQTGELLPLPYTLFSSNQVTDAFRYMATGKHIGKVVICVRHFSTLAIPAVPRTYFYTHKSYAIVGGLGGMGLEVVNWMVSRGASNFVLISRSGVTTSYQTYRINVWREKGVNVIVNDWDVSTQTGAEKALQVAAELGPVGGIFNLAVVLRDAIFTNQTAANFEIVGKAKILASKELDKASRIFAPKLDHFVCFSSIASSMGNAGQTSYGFANSFMERLCEERRVQGFPGLAIQWGAVGEVGILNDLLGGKEVVVGPVASQKISSCLEIFDLFLKQTQPVVSSFVPVTKLAKKNVGAETCVELVAHVLAIKNPAKVNQESTLIELGMDSLMVQEIKILLENKKCIYLPVTTIATLTFSKLIEMETGQLGSENDPTIETQQVTLQPMPSQAIVKMSSKGTNPRTLFIIHPLDGTIYLLERLMQAVDLIVYGLQSIKEAPIDSIEALAGFYLEQIKTVQESGPYQIGGYSYGAAVAFELVIQLERCGDAVENLVLLDGCHIWPKFFAQTCIEKGTDRDELAWLLYFIFLNRPVYPGASNIEAEMSTLSISDKLTKTAEILHEVYPNYSLDEIRDLATSYLNKLKAGYEYTPSARVKSVTTLIRAGATGFDKKLGNDYELNQVCERPVNVLVTDGNHYCFHERPLELGIPKMINEIFFG